VIDLQKAVEEGEGVLPCVNADAKGVRWSCGKPVVPPLPPDDHGDDDDAWKMKSSSGDDDWDLVSPQSSTTSTLASDYHHHHKAPETTTIPLPQRKPEIMLSNHHDRTTTTSLTSPPHNSRHDDLSIEAISCHSLYSKNSNYTTSSRGVESQKPFRKRQTTFFVRSLDVMDLDDAAPEYISNFYTQSDLSVALSPYIPQKAIRDLLANYRKLKTHHRRPVMIDRSFVGAYGVGVGIPIGRYEESVMVSLKRMEREKVIEAQRLRKRLLEGSTGQWQEYNTPKVGLKFEEEDGIIWLDCHGLSTTTTPYYIPRDQKAHVITREKQKEHGGPMQEEQEEALGEYEVLYRHLKGDKDLLDFASLCKWDHLLTLLLDGYLTRATAKALFDEAHQGRNKQKLNYSDFVNFSMMLHAHLNTVYEPTVIQSQVAQVRG